MSGLSKFPNWIDWICLDCLDHQSVELGLLSSLYFFQELQQQLLKLDSVFPQRERDSADSDLSARDRLNQIPVVGNNAVNTLYCFCENFMLFRDIIYARVRPLSRASGKARVGQTTLSPFSMLELTD